MLCRISLINKINGYKIDTCPVLQSYIIKLKLPNDSKIEKIV